MKSKVKTTTIRQILIKYLVIIGLSMLAYSVFLLTILIIMRSFVWDGTEPIYRVLHLIYRRFNFEGLLIIGVMLILFVVTLFFVLKIIGYLKEIIDATKQLLEKPDQRVKLSSDLFELQEEMNQLREKNNADNRAAKEAEKRKNDLIVYLAHDLRTPLTSVIGYLTLLKEEPEISIQTRAKYTNIALSKAFRLEELLSEFFDVTRFNLTNLTIKEELVDLSVMLEQISYEFLPILEEKKLSWNLHIESNIKSLLDPGKMERVFDNLMRNAINYSFEDTIIDLSLEKKKSQAIFKITNKTYTIPKEKLEKIFEPFYRMDTSRSSSTGGTGLGLPIVKEIIEASKGTIDVSSSNNEMTFMIYLPCID